MDLLIIENEPQLAYELTVVTVIFKCDEAKSFRPARLAVHHNRGVYDLSKSGKEHAYRIRRRVRCQAANEIPRVSQVFLARNRAFRVDLFVTAAAAGDCVFAWLIPL